ncbi:MAG TPA: 4'-phosphopantetheinyl transferase superfamily protein [Vicinamibacteria bacterium]|nr:4'-phosphopantetheinyl transferase superfamily protein [Vicinamibacteria bacterium]
MADPLPWTSPPAPAVLGPGEVHVWLAGQPAEHTRHLRRDHLTTVLSADEQVRANRFYFAKDRERYVDARALLRVLVAGYLGTPPGEVQFAYGGHGKPALPKPEGGTRDLRFNVSHSGGVALLAFAWGRELGIDIEGERPMANWQAIAATCFSSRERAHLERLSPAERDQAFFRYWTRKEAFIKATGEGLSGALDRFDMSLAPGAPARVLDSGRMEEMTGWWLEDLHPLTGFAAAVVTEGPPTRITCWRYGDPPEVSRNPPR